MGYIAVIDTETNWQDEVMSMGIVLGDDRTFCPVDSEYFILAPEYETGGMYSGVLDLVREEKTTVCSRTQAMRQLKSWLRASGTDRLFAYNAVFDCKHLTELNAFRWYDIMRIAAYRQHNRKIPRCCPCCSTGRMKSHYGVEAMTRMLTGDCSYEETHNALFDALDELRIMKLLGLPIEHYEAAAL